MMSDTMGETVDRYHEYDMNFTADVSRQMQMPDRIAAFGGIRQLDGFKIDTSIAFNSEAPMFGMTMPDRIFLGKLFKSLVAIDSSFWILFAIVM